MTGEPDCADLAGRLLLLVGRLARRARQDSSAGLTPSQLAILATLAQTGELRVGELATRERIGAPAATRLVASLEDLGLLVRRADRADGRSSRVALSAAGRRRLDRVLRERTALLAERLRRLPAEDSRRLGRALPVLEALVEPAEAERSR